MDRPVVVTDEATLIHWGPIVAGMLTAFGIFVLLGLTALAAGLQVSPLGQGGDPTFGVAGASIIVAIFLVIAFFAGGLVAAWSSVLVDPEQAALHGFLVWALWVLLHLVLVGFGADATMGIAAQIFGQQFQPGGGGGVSGQDIVALFRSAAWEMLFALVLAVIASILGGLAATRPEVRARLPRLRW